MQAEIKAPARACAGAPVTVHYTLGYDFISHHRDDWMGLFEVGSNDTPYGSTCVARQTLPPANKGSVTFYDHPVYPGLYQFHVFSRRYGDKLIGKSNMMRGTVKTALCNREGRMRRREVRMYLSRSIHGTHDEYVALREHVWPELERIAERLQTTIHLVDLRRSLTSDRVKRRPDQSLDICLDQVDECRPYLTCVVGRHYGWLPMTSDNPRALHRK